MTEDEVKSKIKEIRNNDIEEKNLRHTQLH